MNDAYKALVPLMKKKSAMTDPEAFHSIVNIVFHDQEAGDYDQVHDEMWNSLPYQYQLMASDLAGLIPAGNLSLLDIGCGTGLATELLLNSGLGPRINEILLLDTSPVMLEKAIARSANWGRKKQTQQGDITAVQGKYDIIVISSVLHHIPDLPAFLAKVSELQNKGGIIFTIHDPAQEALEGTVYKQRVADHNADNQPDLQPQKSIITRAINKIKRSLQGPGYIATVNKILLKREVIFEPLTEVEIWSITDIHVEGLPYSANNGISKNMLTTALPGYDLISYRTYGFFGTLSSNLNSAYQIKERELSEANDLNGRNFGSVWIKRKP